MLACRRRSRAESRSLLRDTPKKLMPHPAWALLSFLSLATACTDTGDGGAASGGASAGSDGGVAGAGQAGAAPAEIGVCGQRGQATVNETSFDGFEEYYLIAEQGFGEDICVVRFDAALVGAAPDGCDDCLFAHLVEFSSPSVVRDDDGVCEHSELAFDSSAIAAVDGSRAAYGFVSEFAGHSSVLLKYDDSSESWQPDGNATYDQVSGAFRFDRRDGFCAY